ncbi:protein kinase [Archangium violaceum]|uniref:serine/threonine-protein kinase n=1 Tax=Archangium violaceum TaxID=83451 RepID=UPI00193B9FED|nr:serine/threonine-protein kinase [Archangium violaceum]QRK09159.1 protein kinase [Archangium violaceum]
MSHPATAPVRVGTILRDTYELISELGKGGMGAVFLAQHLRLPGKQVAVKVLHCQEEVSPELHARFQREAEITSRLGHPNIVEVLDFHSMEDGTPYLVMEYLRGESLSKRMRKGPLPLQEALLIARQIGSALHTAHQAGVIHRDLKPGNVYLVPTESGGVLHERVKLLDFGISKLVSAQTLHTQEDVLIGTPRYMSPEQAKGKNRELDARSDLFSLGAIVYEMLAGRPPFNSESVAGLIYNIVHDPPVPLSQLCPDLPAEVVAAVERALAKEPQERFPDVASFIEALTGTPLQSLPKPQPQPSPEPRRPRQEIVTAGPRAAPTPPQAEAPNRTVALRPGAAAKSKVAEEPALAVVSAPEAPLPAAPPKSKAPMAVGAAVLILVAATAGWWLLRTAPAPTVSAPESTAKAEPSPKPADPPPPPAVESPAQAQAEAEPPSEQRPEEPAVSEQTPAPTAAEPGPSARAPTRQVTAEVMPQAVRMDLEEAEKALAANDAAEAIRLARRSQRTKVTKASFSLLTRAHCRQGDLTNARAQWEKVLPAERNRVRQYCKLYEINL